MAEFLDGAIRLRGVAKSLDLAQAEGGGKAHDFKDHRM